jgi:peptide chain release factor subunit 3
MSSVSLRKRPASNILATYHSHETPFIFVIFITTPKKDVMLGFVLCSLKHPVHAVSKFEAALAILDLKNIISSGYTAVLHIHTAIEEITLTGMMHLIDKKTGRKSKRPPQFLKKGQQGIVMIETAGPLCVETFADTPQMGRFTLRDEGKTIAIGKITKLHGSGSGIDGEGGAE